MTSPNEDSPTMKPKDGLRSSKAFVDIGSKVGHHLIHRGPTEKFLDTVPDELAVPIRKAFSLGFKKVGRVLMSGEDRIQTEMNQKIYMNTDSGTPEETFSEVPADYLKNLFPYGKQEQWPTQLVMCAKDVRPDPAMLRKAMLTFPEIVGDVLEKPIDVVQNFDEDVAGKTVILGTYNTSPTILHNCSDVLDRVLEMQADPHAVEHISPAARVACHTLLEMVTLKKDDNKTILREDTAEVFRHVMTHGYSQGGNIAADTFRYMRHLLETGNYQLAQDAKGQKTQNIGSPKSIGDLLHNAYIFTFAAADLPYHPQEQATMPPRDNVRSDGDIVIAAAIGTNRRQRNYQSQWRQDAPSLHRHDRFVETIGPKKGFLKSAGKDISYHSMLGHGDDVYRDSVVQFGKDVLIDRWAARFENRACASDITFDHGQIILDFDYGTRPDAMRQTSDALTTHMQTKLGKNAEIVRTEGNPYQLTLKAEPSHQVLSALQEALEKHDIEAAHEVRHALDIEPAREWLHANMQNLPDFQISVSTKGDGPVLELKPIEQAQEMGKHVRNMFQSSLKKIGLTVGNRIASAGEAIEVPVHDVINAMKAQRAQDTAKGIAR